VKVTIAVVALVVACTASAFAQTKSPVSDTVREILSGRQKNIIAAVEAMPADKFNYKPTPEQMTFGHLAAHIAEANNLFCAKAADVAEPKTEVKETEGKDKLVAAVKQSFDFCTASLAKTDDSKLADTIEAFGGKKQPRAWAFIALASSLADHYGAAAMYLRLNGILPPTAQKK
jgi:uncharacterized damage-inducible protein DinB